MYYPIGWHKVLNLHLDKESIPSSTKPPPSILSIQANHERDLIFILTTKSIHIWFPRPAVEIVCHRRSNESIESLGSNKSAVWRTDSSVIVVATENDQLLFYQIQRRFTKTSSSSFLLSNSSESDLIYKLKGDHQQAKGLKNILNGKNILPISKEGDIRKTFLTNSDVPSLTIYSFGKLDLSSIGIACLMSAEEELIVGARNGDIYGVFWNGNVDDKFPWSLSKDVKKGSDYLVDLKFSSIVSGFSLVFNSGRVGFLPLKSTSAKQNNNKDNSKCQNLVNGDSVKKHQEDGRESVTRLRYFAPVNDAVCTEINHRYRLIAIGLKSSRIIVCNIDDINSKLVLNHELHFQSSEHQNNSSNLGPVNCMHYSPDGAAIVTSWLNGHFAIWSVFGSLLFCSQQWQSDLLSDQPLSPMRISCLTWAREGANLWFSTSRDKCNDVIQTKNGLSDEERMKTSLSSFNESFHSEEVVVISIARSNLNSSPHTTCSSDSIVLIAEDRIYVGPSEPHKAKFDHWFVIDIPQQYLESNFPIRYATVDRECKNLAIAGNRGFAIYFIECGRWKFFNNNNPKSTNDENFSVCGDIIWWHNYIVLSCFCSNTETFQLRAYSADETLDENHATILTTSMEIIRMSIFENRILVLYSDGTLGMFMLNLRRKPNSFRKTSKFILNFNSSSTENGVPLPEPRVQRSDSIVSLRSQRKENFLSRDFIVQISSIENLIISNLQANSYCISSIALTRLHFKNNRLDDSILLNACGKLFLLEREALPNLSKSSPSPKLSPDNDSNTHVEMMCDLSLDESAAGSGRISNISDNNLKVDSARKISNSIHFASASLKQHLIEQPSALANVTFKAISVIATNVEQFWISPEISKASEMSYFKKSLWLYCGGLNNYLQVWLPLLNDPKDPPCDLYVPDRIMLPIKCDIYPLAIRSSAPDVVDPDDAIVLGAESDILYRDSSLFNYFPYITVKRQCRVYLHRILRELLLAQHLGYYARKIAESCQSLPYFAHCFELLLHEVLEEEATSPSPLPDPMLPQVVRFIKEFPVYLETVVHCARKSELSMWPHLFDERAVGNPRRLFQECIDKHKLDTAASCLIILQSLDRNIVSQRMVKELIKAAKDDEKFNYLIGDLEGFLTRAELDYSSSPSASGSPTN